MKTKHRVAWKTQS